MGQLYAYNYAIIDLTSGWCLQVRTTTLEINDPDFIEIPVYDENYVFKYYNQVDGNWYEDAEFTIPWQSDLI